MWMGTEQSLQSDSKKSSVGLPRDRLYQLVNLETIVLLNKYFISLIRGDCPLVKLLLLLVVLCLPGCSSGRAKIEDTKQKGNQIIRALEQFRADHGRYPKSLTDLSPRHIRELSPPTWGLKMWEYESDGKAFTLGVDESIHTGDGDSRWLRYQGQKWGWQIGD